jgi:hypothetical protein
LVRSLESKEGTEMSNGKGDKPRPVDRKRFEKNFDAIDFSNNQHCGRLCCECKKVLPNDWDYAACKSCAEKIDYDYAQDDMNYQAFKER